MIERTPMFGWNYVRAAVAAHPNTPPETLQQLQGFAVSESLRLAGTDPYSEDAHDPSSEFWDPDGEDRMPVGDELVWAADVIQQAIAQNRQPARERQHT